MSTDVNVLEFTRKELLPDTLLYQTDDGTNFYHESQTSPHRLYVKQNGKRVAAKLPHSTIQNVCTDGNFLYFEAQRKVYEATFSVSGVKVECIRSLLENEEIRGDGLCSITREGVQYVLRLSDNPERDGVRIDVSDEELKGMELKGIHRGRAIYIGYHHKLSAQTLNDNVIIVQVPQRYYEVCTYSQYRTPLFFIANGPNLFTLDLQSMELLPSLRFRHGWIYSIAGVCGNVLTAIGGFENGEFNMITAELPKTFFEDRGTVHRERIKGQRRQSARDESISAFEMVNAPAFRRASSWESPIISAKVGNSRFRSRRNVDFAVEAYELIKQLEDEDLTMKDNESVLPAPSKERSERTVAPVSNTGNILPVFTSASRQFEERRLTNVMMPQRAKEHSDLSGARWLHERVELLQMNIEYEKELLQAQDDAEILRKQIIDLENSLIANSLNALQSANSEALKFTELEELSKQVVCFQMENGTIVRFKTVKPVELFATLEEIRVEDGLRFLIETNAAADLKLWKNESEVLFRGSIGHVAYFTATSGNHFTCYKAVVGNGQIAVEEINQLNTSDVVLFDSQPHYFIEDQREWTVHKYEENHKTYEGEKFDVSGMRSISKYEHHYHRGKLYFFRGNDTARLERLNEKVVIVESPILKGLLSIYTPSHCNCIYIVNADLKILLIFNTINLNVWKQSYEPLIDSIAHTFVGVHEGTLTMSFEGKEGGRRLMSTKLI